MYYSVYHFKVYDRVEFACFGYYFSIRENISQASGNVDSEVRRTHSSGMRASFTFGFLLFIRPGKQD